MRAARLASAAILATILAAGCATSAPAPSPAPPAKPAPAPPAPPMGAATISAAELKRDLYAFADDSMLGRDASTGDAVRAAKWLAARAQAAGLEPAGDSGGYLQRVPLVREYLGRGSRATITSGAGATELAVGPRLLPVLALGDSEPLPRMAAQGEMVFAGYAIADSAVADPIAGRSISGKVVVFVMGEPPALDSAARAELRGLHPLAERVAMLADRGPAAVIAVLPKDASPALVEAWGELADSAIHLDPNPGRARTLPMVLLCDARAAAPLLPAGWPRRESPAYAPARRFWARMDLVRREIPAYNVVAVRRGADAALAGTYVAFGAHLDHIGIQPNAGSDTIANGADDDGSGSVALVAIGRAAVTQRPAPRRSMLFVWHTGEELGLFGSDWFTSHPTVPLDSIVAQLNADMIGRNAADSLYLVGPAAAPRHQSEALGRVVDAVNASLPRPFVIDRDWDSPVHPEQIYYRSDHYNYARNGIPVVFFTSGLHRDYHKVSDEPSKIDYAKLARVAAFIYDVGLAVADRPTRLWVPPEP